MAITTELETTMKNVSASSKKTHAKKSTKNADRIAEAALSLSAQQLQEAALAAVRATSYHQGFEQGKREPRGTSVEALVAAVCEADDELQKVVQDLQTVGFAIHGVASTGPDDLAPAALEGTLQRAEDRLGEVMRALDAARVAVREQVTT